jgi:hypothetical protein
LAAIKHKTKAIPLNNECYTGSAQSEQTHDWNKPCKALELEPAKQNP